MERKEDNVQCQIIYTENLKFLYKRKTKCALNFEQIQFDEAHGLSTI